MTASLGSGWEETSNGTWQLAKSSPEARRSGVEVVSLRIHEYDYDLILWLNTYPDAVSNHFTKILWSVEMTYDTTASLACAVTSSKAPGLN
jgi:hypothetical protein